jgi:NADPH:quinone reductase
VKSPGPGYLLVAIRACGLNRADIGLYDQTGSLPGRELAGEVVAIGDAVTKWRIGDRVMALGAGLSLDPVVVPTAVAMRVPEAFTWAEAGSLPVALLTMHDALATRGRLMPGARALVHAATSGVGVTGIQLAGLLGASVVYATSRSATKLRILREYVGLVGCELVCIDTSSSPFETVASDVDVTIDTIGASITAGNIAAAAIGGRIIQVGRLGGRTTELDLDELARKRIELIGVTFRTRNQEDVAEVVRRAVTDVDDRFDRVRPRVEQTYPLDQWKAALKDLGRNDHVGKLVLLK